MRASGSTGSARSWARSPPRSPTCGSTGPASMNRPCPWARLEAMETAGKLMLVAAALLAVGGVIALVLARLGVNRLPGDFVVRGENWSVFARLGTMLLVSVVLTIVV